MLQWQFIQPMRKNMNITEFNRIEDGLPREGDPVIAFLPFLESPETKEVIGMTAIALYYGEGSSYQVNGETIAIPEGFYYSDALPYRDDTGRVKLSNTLMPLRFQPTLWKELKIFKEAPTKSASPIQLS